MSSMIHLCIGRIEIDWGQNGGFTDHSPLFQDGDVKQIPYYYVAHYDEDGPPISYVDGNGSRRFELFAELKDGTSKPLWQVVDRIRLLGFNIGFCTEDFSQYSRSSPLEDLLKFSDFARLLATMDTRVLLAGSEKMGDSFGRFFRSELVPLLDLELVPEEDDGYNRLNPFENMEDLHPYTVLQLLAANPSARELPVSWQFADVEEGGWVERDWLIRRLDPRHRFLIVTEGSSDAKILRHALEMLRPHLTDFFDFVDMEEGYPFTGTGNVHKFLQGLIAISIQNSVVVLYDNDAEGLASHRRSSNLNLPDNIRVSRLPDHPAFMAFDTVGPGGRFTADINGQAAAIECYLDLGSDAVVRWTSFNRDGQSYQGELLGKTGHAKTFLNQRARVEGYDYSRIEAVLDLVIDTCADMRAMRFEAGTDEEEPDTQD